MPAANLDTSWALGLNQAVAQQLSFGKDILFTLGPYSSIYTKVYHPSTDFMMISGCLYLAFFYWLVLMQLIKGLGWRWFFVFPLFFCGIIFSRDSLFFSYPLLVGLFSYKLIDQPEKSKAAAFILASLFPPFGLLSLVKGTFFILCFCSSIIIVSFLIINKKLILALVCIAVYLLSTILFWLGSGQKLIYLGPYFFQTLSLSSNFSEAMGTEEKNWQIYLFLLSAFFILMVISWQKQTPIRSRVFLFILYFLFLFISFKAGFVRHFGHAIIPQISILLASLSLIVLCTTPFILFIILFAACTWGAIDSNYARINFKQVIKSFYYPLWNGLKNRYADKNWANKNFELSLAYLKKNLPLPRLNGRTDIYSYHQSYLFASKNHWSPRPVFQSYSVFNASLAKANRDHLMSKLGPDHIFFRIEPIDNRLPALEDGASWPTLIQKYQPIQFFNDFLYLKKIHPLVRKRPVYNLSRETHRFGEQVRINSQKNLFARIELRPSFWGKIAMFFFKPSPIYIQFILKDGTEREYRLIANMAKTSFLISPLIENTEEFFLLFGKEGQLEDKKLQSFTLRSINHSKHWQEHYIVKFKS